MSDPDIDYEALQELRLPAPLRMGDVSATVIDFAIYRRLSAEDNPNGFPSDKALFRQHVLDTIEQQDWMKLPARENLKRRFIDMLDKDEPESMAAVLADIDKDGVRDPHMFIIMDSDKLDPNSVIYSASIMKKASFTPAEADIFKHFIFEHEKAHVMGFSEPGSDFMATISTLEKYGPDATRVLQAFADYRMMEPFIFDGKISVLPGYDITSEIVSKYGYECHNAIVNAMKVFERTKSTPEDMRSRIFEGMAHNHDYIAILNASESLEKQPEMRVKSDLESSSPGLWVSLEKRLSQRKLNVLEDKKPGDFLGPEDLVNISRSLQKLKEKFSPDSVEGAIIQNLAAAYQRTVGADNSIVANPVPGFVPILNPISPVSQPL